MGINAEYMGRTGGSAEAFARSRKYHVNGVHHNIRFFEPYPFVTRSAGGRFLTDVDSNKYVDYWMGHWSLILGHAPGPVKEAIKRQLDSGWMHGTVSEPTMRLSEVLQRCVPVAEKIRYVSSGTEAAMYAVRLARARTGRRIIAKADGGWHGYTSELLKTVNWPFDISESSGLVGEEHVVSIPYNDLEGSLEILASAGGDLACIIIEPVLGGGGCIPADADYLKGIQEFAQKNGSLFILDEIVTGFRFRFGCLYPEMGLDPDIVILGKIIGGGLAIGAMCGRDEIMEMSNTGSFGKQERAYIGGGTFSANPATMSAGHATLDELGRNSNAIYPRINGLGDLARKRLEKIFDGRVRATGKGSLFMTHFVGKDMRDVSSAADAAGCDREMLYKYHLEMITRDGIFFLPGKLGAISAAHTGGDLEAMFAASERFSGDL